MNWQVNKYVLPVLIISFLFSCRSKDGEIGPRTYSSIGTHYTDTISLKTSTVLLNDSLATSTRITLPGQTTTYLSYFLLGQYADSDPFSTGNVTASVYTQLRLETENVDLSGVTSVSDIDSAFIYLDYRGYGYGDTTGTQYIDAFELTSALDKDGVYFNTSPAPSINPTSILATSPYPIEVRPHSTNEDGTGRLKIALDPDWAYHILSLGGTTSDDFVATKLHGIAIIPQGSPEGAVMRINLGSTLTELVIYHSEGSSYTLTMTTNGQGFSRITSDRTSTSFSSIALKTSTPSESTGDVTYMQAGVGVKTKVEFPFLSMFKEAVGDNIVINKAVLYIPIQNGTADDYANSQAFYMIRTDQTNIAARNSQGNIAYLQSTNYNQNLSGHDLLVIYDTTTKTYQADVTDYVRDMLNQRLPNTGVFISPSGMAVGVERTILNSASSVWVNDRMKLQLYYTIKE